MSAHRPIPAADRFTVKFDRQTVVLLILAAQAKRREVLAIARRNLRGSEARRKMRDRARCYDAAACQLLDVPSDADLRLNRETARHSRELKAIASAMSAA